MANVKVIFGSTTGATESAAAEIAAAFGVQAINVANATADDFKADLLILGSSTWGLGELQDDWVVKIGLLENAVDMPNCKPCRFKDVNGVTCL